MNGNHFATDTAKFNCQKLILTPKSEVTGPGNLLVNDDTPAEWQGGKMTGTGKTIIGTKFGSKPATLAIGNAAENSTFIVSQRTIENFGTVTVKAAGNIQFSNGAKFVNQTPAKGISKLVSTVNFQDDSSMLGDKTTKFNNNAGALVTKTGGLRTSSVTLVFTGEGKVVISSGTLKIPTDDQVGLKARTTIQGTKAVLSTDGLLRLEGGMLENIGDAAQDGEVFGDVLNTGGEVDPGGVGSTGILTIDGTNGTYTQNGSGSLNIDIAGPRPGTQYDRLIVTGIVTLGGKLNINAVPGFTGNSFDILVNESGQSIQGQFDGLPEGAEIILDGRQFFITYHGGASGNDVVLNDGMATLNKLNDSITGIVSFNDGQGHSGSEDVYLSQFNVTCTTGPTSTVTFNTFCIDLTHTVAVGQTYAVNARTDVAGAFTNGSRMAYIYEQYGIQDLSDNPDQAAAVQLAEWDLLLDNHNPQAFGLDAGTTSEYSSGDPAVFKVDLGSNPDAAKIAGEVDSLLKESIGATTPGAWLDASAAGDAANRGQSLLIPETALKQVIPAPALQWEGGYPSAPSNGPALDAFFAIWSDLSRK